MRQIDCRGMRVANRCSGSHLKHYDLDHLFFFHWRVYFDIYRRVADRVGYDRRAVVRLGQRYPARIHWYRGVGWTDDPGRASWADA